MDKEQKCEHIPPVTKKYSGILGGIRVFVMRMRLVAGWIKTRFLESKYGIETDNYNAMFGKVTGEGNYRYQPTPYGRLERVMQFLRPMDQDVFVDLGCGKGRAVFVAAKHPFKKVIGVEADKEIYDIAVQNTENFKKKFKTLTPVELFHVDAADFDPRASTVFFMFNPFGPDVMEKVLANIKNSLLSNPRRVRIAYYAPHCKELMAKQEWLSPIGLVENESCLVWESNLYSKTLGVEKHATKD